LKKENIDKNTEIQDNITKGNNRPTLSVDLGYYQSYLDDSNIPDDRKRELVKTVWNITLSFVDLGFGLNPTQQVIQENLESVPKLILEGMQDSIPKETFGASINKE